MPRLDCRNPDKQVVSTDDDDVVVVIDDDAVVVDGDGARTQS